MTKNMYIKGKLVEKSKKRWKKKGDGKNMKLFIRHMITVDDNKVPLSSLQAILSGVS